jgi:hypothetical protein
MQGKAYPSPHTTCKAEDLCPAQNRRDRSVASSTTGLKLRGSREPAGRRSVRFLLSPIGRQNDEKTEPIRHVR